MRTQLKESVPPSMRPLYEHVTRRTDALCHERIDEVFSVLCCQLNGSFILRQRGGPHNTTVVKLLFSVLWNSPLSESRLQAETG